MPPDDESKHVTSTSGWAQLTRELVHGTPAKVKAIQGAAAAFRQLKRR